MPIIRYADVLLMWAEALNEQSFSPEALALVNQVRARAGVATLQSANGARMVWEGNVHTYSYLGDHLYKGLSPRWKWKETRIWYRILAGLINRKLKYPDPCSGICES